MIRRVGRPIFPQRPWLLIASPTRWRLGCLSTSVGTGAITEQCASWGPAGAPICRSPGKTSRVANGTWRGDAPAPFRPTPAPRKSAAPVRSVSDQQQGSQQRHQAEFCVVFLTVASFTAGVDTRSTDPSSLVPSPGGLPGGLYCVLWRININRHNHSKAVTTLHEPDP